MPLYSVGRKEAIFEAQYQAFPEPHLHLLKSCVRVQNGHLHFLPADAFALSKVVQMIRSKAYCLLHVPPVSAHGL